MTSLHPLTFLTRALEKDFASFCEKTGADASGVNFHLDLYGSEAVVKMTYAEEDAKTAQAYANALKKKFSYIADGEGEEFAIDLVIPTARGTDLIHALNNPSAPQLAKAFNTVVFTGALTVSRAEAEAAAETAGFKVGSSVTKDTDYLVAGDNPGSKLDKAHDLGVKVLTEPQWARLLKKSGPK